MSKQEKRLERKVKEANRQLRKIFAVIVFGSIALILYLAWCPQCHGPIVQNMVDKIFSWFGF